MNDSRWLWDGTDVSLSVTGQLAKDCMCQQTLAVNCKPRADNVLGCHSRDPTCCSLSPALRHTLLCRLPQTRTHALLPPGPD